MTIVSASLVCVGAARAAIEFTGILATPQKSLFALADTDTGKTEWVGVGRTFSGQTVTSFDAASETLTLTQGDIITRIRLKNDAKIQSARLDLAGTITFGVGEKVEVVRAMLPYGVETVLPLKDGVLCKLTPQRLEDGNLRFRAVFERVLAPNKTERIAVPSVTVLPGHPFGLKVGDIEFSFTPR
jgi:hypothetical protein